MMDYALMYAARGWAVFPCKPKDKVPATRHGVLDLSLIHISEPTRPY